MNGFKTVEINNIKLISDKRLPEYAIFGHPATMKELAAEFKRLLIIERKYNE